MSLKDLVFQVHNEVIIKDGRTLYATRERLIDIDGHHIGSRQHYNEDLTDKHASPNYDIMKVYNPITKKLVYMRDTVDWNTIKVDTPILVSHYGSMWERRYYAGCNDGEVLTFMHGATSWSNNAEGSLINWKYAKLYKEER